MTLRRTHNLKSLKSLRRQLRAHMTPAEACLWRHLQRSQLDGRKFRRQQSIGRYVVDFYCPAERLVIELDGAVHDSDTAWKQDQQRTRFLESLGLRVLHFENRDVLRDLEGVLAQVRAGFGASS